MYLSALQLGMICQIASQRKTTPADIVPTLNDVK
jgi:hypothetical protein